MKRIKVFLIFTIIFLIICLMAFIILIRDKIPKNIFCFLDIGTYHIPPKSVEVNASNIYGQTFISNFDNLFMMSIFIPKQNLNSDKELLFHLKQNKDEDKDLVVLKWKFNQIRFAENSFYIIPPDRESTKEGFHFGFQFSPIKDSKDREFYFYFESPNVETGKGIKLGFWDNRDYYEALRRGRMFINHRPVNGFLAFRTFNTWSGNYSLLIDEIKFRLLKDRAFLLFYCISLFIICLITITLFIKPKIFGVNN